MALFSEAGLPASYVALPFNEWQLRPEWPAVSLANTDPVEDLAPHVGRLRLIVLEFPRFSDGRAYSQARLLRGRLGYRGELRATGGVLQDQIAFMLRCGFDSFESEQKGFGEALAGRGPCSAWSISRPRTIRCLFLFVDWGATPPRCPDQASPLSGWEWSHSRASSTESKILACPVNLPRLMKRRARSAPKPGRGISARGPRLARLA